MPSISTTMMDPKLDFFNVPLLRNEKGIERPANQITLTKLPTDRPMDGVDLSTTLKKGGSSPRKEMFYYAAVWLPCDGGHTSCTSPGGNSRRRVAPQSMFLRLAPSSTTSTWF